MRKNCWRQKAIAMVLVLALTLGMAACGSGTSSAKGSGNTVSTESAAASTDSNLTTGDEQEQEEDGDKISFEDLSNLGNNPNNVVQCYHGRIAFDDDYIYFVMTDDIYRVKYDGSNLEALGVDCKVDGYLNIVDDVIYFAGNYGDEDRSYECDICQYDLSTGETSKFVSVDSADSSSDLDKVSTMLAMDSYLYVVINEKLSTTNYAEIRVYDLVNTYEDGLPVKGTAFSCSGIAEFPSLTSDGENVYFVWSENKQDAFYPVNHFYRIETDAEEYYVTELNSFSACDRDAQTYLFGTNGIMAIGRSDNVVCKYFARTYEGDLLDTEYYFGKGGDYYTDWITDNGRRFVIDDSLFLIPENKSYVDAGSNTVRCPLEVVICRDMDLANPELVYTMNADSECDSTTECLYGVHDDMLYLIDYSGDSDIHLASINADGDVTELR